MKTSPSKAEGTGSIPGQRTEIPTCLGVWPEIKFKKKVGMDKTE